MRVMSFIDDLSCQFFTQRVANNWNSLPEEGVESDTITMFQKHSYSYLCRQGIASYGPDVGRWMGSTDVVGGRACFCAL